MPLSKEQVEKFRKLYEEIFKKEISYKDALGSGTKLVNLMRILCNLKH